MASLMRGKKKKEENAECLKKNNSKPIQQGSILLSCLAKNRRKNKLGKMPSYYTKTFVQFFAILFHSMMTFSSWVCRGRCNSSFAFFFSSLFHH
jgi:hypothetical protein